MCLYQKGKFKGVGEKEGKGEGKKGEKEGRVKVSKGLVAGKIKGSGGGGGGGGGGGVGNISPCTYESQGSNPIFA